MAVNEVQDYLDNGNIRNSVNYPDLNAGVCETAGHPVVFGQKIIDPKAKTIDVYVLQNGRYAMTGSYHPYTETEWEGLDEEEKEEALLPLKLSLYEDLVIDVKEVFEE